MTGAATMTYDSLVADIIAYAERSSDTSFIDRVPRFIALCENRLAVEVRGLGILQTVTGTLASAVMDKPVRWRETRNFSILVGAERRFIFERSYEYCRAFWPDSSLTAEPRYYADYDYEHFQTTVADTEHVDTLPRDPGRNRPLSSRRHPRTDAHSRKKCLQIGAPILPRRGKPRMTEKQGQDHRERI